MEQYYQIADLVLKFDFSGRTFLQAEKYICDSVEDADIEFDMDAFQESYRYLCEKYNGTNYTYNDIEYMVTGLHFYRKLLSFDGFMMHSSAVVVDNQAYLFSANSGTGKSTHTELWLKLFSDRAYILNDDKPAVRMVDGVWYAYGTPWSGKHDISVNARVPIAGVAFLERAEKNSITRMDPGDAAMALIMQINRSRFPEAMEKLFDLYEKFVQQVPVWNLKCNMDPEAAIVSYEAMSGEKFVPNK